MEDRMLKWFAYTHLPDGPVRQTAMKFRGMAEYVIDSLAPGPERTVALRKLLEAKDAAVRSAIHEGG